MSSQHHKEAWELFLKLCCSIEDPELLDKFLSFILTPEECEMLATRIVITQELLKGERSQRTIAADIGVSIAKITRGSNGLKGIDETLLKFLKEKLVDQ
jgi:TrpR family trp operon transcriptional repressor